MMMAPQPEMIMSSTMTTKEHPHHPQHHDGAGGGGRATGRGRPAAPSAALASASAAALRGASPSGGITPVIALKGVSKKAKQAEAHKQMAVAREVHAQEIRR